MKGRDNRLEADSGLRRQAEEIAMARIVRLPVNFKAQSSEEQRIIHELRVYQVELEIQNEELRTAQAKLDAARARYFDLYDLAPVGYCTLSEKGLVLESNLTAANLLGVARWELDKQPITRFILKEDQDIYYLHRKRLFETAKPQTCELQMVRQNGTSFWARLEATAAQDIDGAPISRIALSDITDSKRIETEKAKIEALNRQLQKSECMGRMAGAIAHNFNNQLHVVMGNLEMAMDGLPSGVNSKESLISALQAARNASEVSSLMLTYLGQTPVKHEHIDLSEASRNSVTLLQATVPNGTIIKADFPAIGPVIRANASQIMQVLTNLVTNAWESADENRRGIGLTVKTVCASDIPTSPRFPVDWQPRDAVYACIEVADAGCGISENDIEKIFDPFFSTKFTGRGLGLPVVLGIVRAHHGAVTVESDSGRGSIFRVFFPVLIETISCQPGKEARLPELEGCGKVLLLVEDAEMVREMTAGMLTHLGFTVLEARDGVEAVEVFRQHQNEIHCVISDLTMPRMDGWETLTALRKLSPGIPVVLSSGYDEAQVMEGEHPERPNAFLGKPYCLQKLRDTILLTLEGQQKSIHYGELTEQQAGLQQ
jgi:two-component system cell cycle sensor histidine kinase/response regulator CckA